MAARGECAATTSDRLPKRVERDDGGEAPRTVPDEIRYGLNHWEGFIRFLDDGRIELDTNIVERGIRPIVLNRRRAHALGLGSSTLSRQARGLTPPLRRATHR